MRRIRGFGVVKALSWVVERRSKYEFTKKTNWAAKVTAKLCHWGRSMKQGAKRLCSSNPNSGYVRVGEEGVVAQSVPKGHLPVYVGEKDEERHRFLVPVVFFNHPLFLNLLYEAEKELGFHHPGPIQIPSRISEFQKVRMKIAASHG